jgi:uncharacterized protein YegL
MIRPVATRPLHFIWVVDCSGSMQEEGKIQSVNTAIRDAIPLMQQTAEENPNARVLVRALAFSSGARWHVERPVPVADFTWSDVRAQGVSDLGAALRMLSQELRTPPMEERALPPVLVLLSDGQPTDDYKEALSELLTVPWGNRAVRIGIAIGRDVDMDVLEEFIANPSIRPLQSNNPDALVRNIQWASTAVLKSVSAPASQAAMPGQATVTVPVPSPVVAYPSGSSQDAIW